MEKKEDYCIVQVFQIISNFIWIKMMAALYHFSHIKELFQWMVVEDLKFLPLLFILVIVFTQNIVKYIFTVFWLHNQINLTS